jgi:hypothetical protein
MDAVAEIHVFAQAGNVVWLASQALSLAQHVVDACFLLAVSQWSRSDVYTWIIRVHHNQEAC